MLLLNIYLRHWYWNCTTFPLSFLPYTYRTIGVYVQTLIIILWRDIFKFLSMFAVVLVVFSGPLYLSLRYDADLANSTTAALLSGEGRWEKIESAMSIALYWISSNVHTVATLTCQPDTNGQDAHYIVHNMVLSWHCVIGNVLRILEGVFY